MNSFKLFCAILLSILIATSAFCGDSIYIDSQGKVGIGTITPRDTLDVEGNVKVAGDVCTDAGNCLNSMGGVVPPGGIIMWSGSIATIPTGWALCDGTNGTPNLRDRFIIGAGNTYNEGSSGGSNTITVANLPSHSHSAGSLIASSGGSHSHTANADPGANSTNGNTFRRDNGTNGTLSTNPAGNHTHSITGSTATTGSGTPFLPKYYALAYIMKI